MLTDLWLNAGGKVGNFSSMEKWRIHATSKESFGVAIWIQHCLCFLKRETYLIFLKEARNIGMCDMYYFYKFLGSCFINF